MQPRDMRTAIGFPGPDEIATRTPADRDRAIDVIRITALVGVVLGHTVMAISIIHFLRRCLTFLGAPASSQ